MKLPRLLPFRRAKPKPDQVPSGAEALAQARARALEQMRARRDAPQDAPQAVVPSVPPGPAVAAPGPEPVADTGAQPEPEAIPSQPEDPLAAAQAAVNEAESQPAEGMDPNLLDIFRDAKQETEEGSLASEVEEVPIRDLLSDLWSIGRRLGVRPASQRPQEPERVTFPAPEPEEENAEAQAPAGAELPRVIQVTTPVPAPDEDPIEALGMPPEAPAGESGDEEETEVEELAVGAGQPASQEGQGGAPEAPAPEAGPPQTAEGADPAGRRYILHGLLLFLALGLAASVGVRGAASGALAGDYGLRPTPAVLAYMKPPAVPQTVQTAPEAPSPTPSPTPEPTPTPSPSPTPAPNFLPLTPKISGPAYFLYTVEPGDSLSSIAAANDICPDHILWNNPGRKEEDPLLVGQRLLLPGVKGIIHRVQPGETLDSIAALYSARPEKIVAVTNNHLAPGQEPVAGTRILVPDGIPPSALLRDEQAQELTHTPSPWGYVWPFFGPITTYYGEERPGYTHLAIDIGGLGAYGAPVGAAAAGTVAEAVHGDAALGNYVKVQHDDGSRTIYAHLSEVYVAPGQTVTTAQPVGALGCTGHATGTHLHFELWIDGKPVDPLDYLP